MDKNEEVGKEVVEKVAVPLVTEDDIKRGGEKDMAQNAEAMVAEKANAGLDIVPAKPSYFIKRTKRCDVLIDVLTKKTNGDVVSVAKSGLGIDYEKSFPIFVHNQLKFEFSYPNYEDMMTYRKRSSRYVKEANQMIVDKADLRNFLLVWHLKAWNMMDEDGKPVVLESDENGSLAESSLAMVYALPPTLMDVVMTAYEKEVLLA
jgi:hypothetical protein